MLDARPFELMAIFKAEVCSQIEEHYGIEVDPLLDILDLTSTRANKFSRHLIVRIPGAVFKSYLDVGAFVAQLISSIEIRVIEGDTRLAKLFVICSTPTPCIFIDSSVYSKVSSRDLINRIGNFDLSIQARSGVSLGSHY